MKWEEIVRDYFSFTKKERNGIIVLLGLIAFFWALPKITRPFKKEIVLSKEDSAFIANKDNIIEAPGDSAVNKEGQRKLFEFDPNTLDGDGWKRLGVRDKTIRTIQNYLSKGGRFRKAGDLEKIYGLKQDDLDALLPLVRIKEPHSHTTTSLPRKEYRAERKILTVDINTADTTAFISLPGIGSKLANRIVSFREKLGGFYSIEQLREVYGIQDSSFQNYRKYLKLSGVVKKININTATVDELKLHPYIKWDLAKVIVAYRNVHGPFKNLGELSGIHALTEDILNKLSHYLVLE